MPSETDDFRSNNAVFIETFSKKRFHLYGDDPDEICIEDIGHATSMITRYTGHCRHFYSVAEHQVLVARILAAWDCDIEVQFQGLMHDSTEAYLADIAAPFKPELGNYYDLELRIWNRIAAKFKINPEMDPVIKVADWVALFVECKHMINAEYQKWYGWEDFGPKSLELMEEHPSIKPKFHMPQNAEAVWRAEFDRLMKLREAS